MSCAHQALFLREKTITETKAKLYKYYGDSAPSISMLTKWFIEFRCGRTSTIDAERAGRPVEIAMPETIEKIRNMVLADRRLKVREIVEAIGMSHGSVVSILKDFLHRFITVDETWIHLNTPETKQQSVGFAG